MKAVRGTVFLLATALILLPTVVLGKDYGNVHGPRLQKATKVLKQEERGIQDITVNGIDGNSEDKLRHHGKLMCSAKIKCTKKGGSCQANYMTCPGEKVGKFCNKGKGCTCCLPYRVNECLGEAHENSVLWHKVDSSETTIRVAETAIKAAVETAIKSNIKEGSKVTDTVREAETAIREAETAIREVETAIKSTIKDGNKVTDTVNECLGEANENSVLWHKVDSSETTIREAETAIREAETAIKEFETAIKSTIKEGAMESNITGNLEYLIECQGAVEIQNNRLETEIKDAKTEITDANSKIGAVETKISNVEIKINNVEIKINNLEAEITDANSKIGAVEIKVNDMKIKINKLEREMADANSKLDHLDSVESKINNVETELQSMNNHQKMSNSKLSSLENELHSMNNKQEIANSKLSVMETKINNLELEIMSMKDNQEMANSKLDILIDLMHLDVCGRNGGVHIGSQCLTFHEERLTWDDAAAACASNGARLATLKDNSQAQEVLSYVITREGSIAFWLGGSDSAIEGTWLWITGEPFDQFPWLEGQPNNWGGNQDCLMVIWYGAYTDDLCTDTHGYICELGVFSQTRMMKPKTNKKYETQRQKKRNNSSSNKDNSNNVNNNSSNNTNN